MFDSLNGRMFHHHFTIFASSSSEVSHSFASPLTLHHPSQAGTLGPRLIIVAFAESFPDLSKCHWKLLGVSKQWVPKMNIEKTQFHTSPESEISKQFLGFFLYYASFMVGSASTGRLVSETTWNLQTSRRFPRRLSWKMWRNDMSMSICTHTHMMYVARLC